ncbi:phosphoribosylaminoimidazole-succinocarboxamide synthase [Achromatium sp. WMS2]|nr:phosphoribosylaminoimidazole-succinocarboxamide synthase [Achromatium sp. WMS2]
MDSQSALFQSEIPQLQLLHRGKVRDLYAVDAQHLLIVTTDRISAFDVVFRQPIPGKGAVLTRLSNFWFRRIRDIIPNHLTDIGIDSIITDSTQFSLLKERTILARRLTPVPVEAVVRGYIIGSGWKDYQRSQEVCGIKLPSGLKLAERLPSPIFTPSTKAAIGSHDENITFAQMIAIVGRDTAEQIKTLSLQIYQECASYAENRGIIIADTKLEFGHDSAGNLVLMDELLTPDSSRFWPADRYQTGISPPSFDKQFVRDYLETIQWDKTPPAPELPDQVIENTAKNYLEAELRLTQ